METFQALFNTVLIVFIVTTMLSAGFNTTFEQIRSVLSKISLVAAVIVAGFVICPAQPETNAAPTASELPAAPHPKAQQTPESTPPTSRRTPNRPIRLAGLPSIPGKSECSRQLQGRLLLVW